MMLRASSKNLHLDPLVINLKSIPHYFLRPVRFLKSYNQNYLRADLTAGLTVAIISLPLSIAFTRRAELPPEMGIDTAIGGGLIGAGWGSAHQT
jgi:MFS superfamily sulfate permease-like transporter